MLFSLSTSSRVLITGVTSIHGWPVFKAFRTLLPPDSLYGIRSPKMAIPDDTNVSSLCITDHCGLTGLRDRFQPTHVIHCAGVCDLDVCEDRPSWAEMMNVQGTRAVCEVFEERSHIMYMSSDLVFSGNEPPGSGYDESHAIDPLSVAGTTIARAEQIIRSCRSWCIVRLGLPIGASITGDKGAIDFVDRRLRRKLPVTLFYDELRSCIGCNDIASVAVVLIAQTIQGLLHCGGPDPVSLYEMGDWVRQRGSHEKSLLKGIYRNQERNGPPRIGNVALNSARLLQISGITSLPSPFAA